MTINYACFVQFGLSDLLNVLLPLSQGGAQRRLWALVLALLVCSRLAAAAGSEKVNTDQTHLSTMLLTQHG